MGSGIPVVSGVEPDTSGAIVRGRCYYLPKHVYACRTDDGVIFLDAKHDRYFGLGGPAIAALPGFIVNWPDEAPRVNNTNESQLAHADIRRAADNLIQRGLLGCDGSDPNPTTRKSAPALSVDLPPAIANARGRMGMPDMIYFALACAQAFWLLKRLPLEAIASRITAARHEEGPLDLVEIFGRVEVFRRLRRLFFSEKNKCLLNALALVLFLRRYGHFPIFVIGVKTRPFGAHSWVQYEHVLLEGDPASVCHFVPILVA